MDTQTNSTHSPTSKAHKLSHQENGQFVAISRLIMGFLGIAITGSLGLALGVILAFFWPKVNPQKPLIIQVWQGLLPQNSTGVESPPLDSANPQKSLQKEVDRLENDVAQLRDRLTQMERKLQVESSELPIEERLHRLEQKLQTEVQLGTEASQHSSSMKVTLPSDMLFIGQTSRFTEEAEIILETILAELTQQEGKTIRIAAHVDTINSVPKSRELSFAQAKMIQQFLAKRLPDQYHWVIVGYGQTRPLVQQETDANRQLNRRLEISVQ